MQQLKYYFGIIKEAFDEWNHDRAPRLGAALAYYTVFSIAPCFLLVVAVVGLFFGQEAAQGQIYGEVKGLVGPESAKTIQDLVASSKNATSGIVATLIGLGVLFLGTTGVVGQIQDALDTVWDVEIEHSETILEMIKRRWISFSIIIAFGFILVVSTLASAALQAVSKRFFDQFPLSTVALELANLLLSLLVLTAFFSILFRFVSNVYLSWRDVITGAAVTSLLFAIGKTVLGVYLGRSAFSSTYGAAGAFVIILVWVYYSAQIFLFGAELTQVIARRSSRVTTPKPGYRFSKENAWTNTIEKHNGRV